VHALVDACADEAALRQAALALLGQAQGRSQPAPPPAQALARPASSRAKAKPRKDTATLTPELIDRIKARGEQTSVLAREAGMARSQLAQMLAAPGARVRKATLKKLERIARATPAAADGASLLAIAQARAQSDGVSLAELLGADAAQRLLGGRPSDDDIAAVRELTA